jgi:hypothetical protein
VPDTRGPNLLRQLSFQLGSLGAFPARILRLPELLVSIGQKRVRLRRFRIPFDRTAQSWQCSVGMSFQKNCIEDGKRSSTGLRDPLGGTLSTERPVTDDEQEKGRPRGRP